MLKTRTMKPNEIQIGMWNTSSISIFAPINSKIIPKRITLTCFFNVTPPHVYDDKPFLLKMVKILSKKGNLPSSRHHVKLDAL